MIKIVNDGEQDEYKVVLIKTIDNNKPIYYRLVNLSNYSIKNIPAYRILDEIINNKLNITNIKCKNNELVIIDNDGYESTSDIIVVDEFDTELDNLYDWALDNGSKGCKVINAFDPDKNAFTLNNFRIDSYDKIYWTCNKNHTIYSGFATYLGTNCECPICKNHALGMEISFELWCKITNNKELLNMYYSAMNNTTYARDLEYNSKRNVWFNNGSSEIKVKLSDITLKGKKICFENFNDTVNIKRNNRNEM